jgi:outer membrane protein assembly factor BamB
MRTPHASAVVLLCLAASVAPTVSVAPARAATQPELWSTYHADNTRGGEDTADSAFGSVAHSWTTTPLDGRIYAQPLLDGNTVIVATENDTLYGLDAQFGGRLWSTHVGTPVTSGLPCGNVNPLGITGTPVLDPATHTVFALAERVPNGGGMEHVLVAVDARNGNLLGERTMDPPGMNVPAQQQRGALLLSSGMVYVPYGGLYGDCSSYHGWVVGTAENLGGGLAVFQTSGSRAGIWEPAGVSADSGGNVYAATGNAANSSACDGGNTVFKLNAALQQLGAFADPNCVNDNNADLDLGSAGALLLPDGSLFVSGKQGVAYTVAQWSMAQRSSLSGLCESSGGDAYSNGRIYQPCVSGGGMIALDYRSSDGALSVAWQGPNDANGSPIVAGGYVWVTSWSNAKLYALNPANGSVAMQFAVPGMEHFTSPSAGGGRVFLGAGTQLVAFSGQNPFVSVPPTQGYWTAASDGGVFSYGTAGFHGSMGATRLNAPVVGMAATPGGAGYWLVASDGGVFAFGNAGFHGSTGGMRLNAPVLGMAATPDGGGYWLVASDGGVFAFGDAGFHGSMGGTRLNQPVVGMAAAPGGGYWLVAADGGIFSFGPGAAFYGSTGALRLNQPVIGMAAVPGGGGYWLVAADGGVFSFGPRAPFMGSTGAIRLNRPMVGIAATTDAGGYRMTASDGGIFDFGDANFYGSQGSAVLNAPMVAIASAG